MSYIQIKPGSASTSAEELLQIGNRLNRYIGELQREKNNRCVVSDGSAAIYDSLGTVVTILDEDSDLIETLSTNLSDIVRIYSQFESETEELFGSTPSFDWSILRIIKEIIEISNEPLNAIDVCRQLENEPSISSWPGSILTILVTIIDNFEEAGYTVNERMTAETVLESAIKIGEAALLNALFSELGPAAPVAAEITTRVLDAFFIRYAGKDFAETMSDEILDYQENKKMYGEEYANEQFVNHTREFFEKIVEDLGNAVETVYDASKVAAGWFNEGMQSKLQYGPLVA